MVIKIDLKKAVKQFLLYSYIAVSGIYMGVAMDHFLRRFQESEPRKSISREIAERR